VALSLYLHIPFCTVRCAYCSFNTYAGLEDLMPAYVDALCKEVNLVGATIGRLGEGGIALEDRRVHTVFFGGGTPSLLPDGAVREILHHVRSAFSVAGDCEITLEANPGTLGAAHLQALRKSGVNRLSLGAQSAQPGELRLLDRAHSFEDVVAAVRWARHAGFDNLNLDLIYGLIGQSMSSWQTNLETALALGPDHLSLYALTIEEGTPLARDIARGRSPGPDLDLQADMFEWTRERMLAAGFEHYEVSNWARPGRKCRHNLVYWHNGDWLGLGAGAHSHLFDERFADAASPLRYIDLVQQQATSNKQQGLDSGHVPCSMFLVPYFPHITFREPADRAREMSETVILALRLREGLDLGAFGRRYDVSFEDAFQGPLEDTLTLGLTEVVDGRLKLRDEAVLLGDEAFLRFLPDE